MHRLDYGCQLWRSHINVGQLGTLEYNSFRWRAIRMFNQLPLFYVMTLYVLFIVSMPARIQQQPGSWRLLEMEDTL